jgi:cytochrome c peroxidase
MLKKLILLCLIASLLLFIGVASANPPTPEEALQLLGKRIYNDKKLSKFRNQSCKSCHHNNYGFVDPANAKNPSKNVVSVGSDKKLTGGLNAPTAAYAAFSPQMYWDGELFIGGVFWNGRAHGHKEFDVDCLVTVNGYALGEIIFSPLAEQSQGPFTNPVEMALPDNAEVVRRVTKADYAYLFNLAFGTVDFNDVVLTFDQIAVAIAYFEESNVLNKFDSDYDSGDFTPGQTDGLALFMNDDNLNDGTGGGAMCVLCHVTDDDGLGVQFTDFSYDNLGIPVNPLIADKGVDPGLGGFIQSVLDYPLNYPDSLVSIIVDAQVGVGGTPDENRGKHKVSTLRNIELTPPYGHNGFFPNLTSIVQFYNTRDPLACSEVVGGVPVTPAFLAAGKIPGYPVPNDYCWPVPEIVVNVNVAELGDLGLSTTDVDSIVLFLEALTDN